MNIVIVSIDHELQLTDPFQRRTDFPLMRAKQLPASGD